MNMSISLIPINGTTSPPNPYTSKFCRSRDSALIALYATPRSASGIRATMMSALKITAESTADCGVCSRMTFSAFNTGNVPANIAGMIAKYLATSFAIENVVSAPRVISNCLPMATISISLVGFESRSTMLPASFAAWVPEFIVGAVTGHRDQLALRLFALDEVHLVLGFGLGKEIIDAGLAGDCRGGEGV